MKPKRAWALQSFLVCMLFNALFAALIFMMADKILDSFTEWLTPFLAQGGDNLSGELHSALTSFGNFVNQLHHYLAPALAVLAGSIMLLLWICTLLLGLRLARRAVETAPCPGKPKEVMEQSASASEQP